MLELAPHEQTMAKNAVRMGEPIPDKVLNAPELKLGLLLYLQAFFDLDSERSHALSPTPIPWSSIIKYAEFYELDEEQADDLLFYIRKLDTEHLKRVAKAQKTPKDGPKSKRPRK